MTQDSTHTQLESIDPMELFDTLQNALEGIKLLDFTFINKEKGLIQTRNDDNLCHYMSTYIHLNDIQKLFRLNPTIHTYTSSVLVDGEVLVMTDRQTSVVTLQEFATLVNHLGFTPDLDITVNARLWVEKNITHAVISNKIPANEPSTCIVDQDVASWHRQLESLLRSASGIWENFVYLARMFPNINFHPPMLKCMKISLSMEGFESLLLAPLAEFRKCIKKTREKRSILGWLFGDSAELKTMDDNLRMAVSRQDQNFRQVEALDHELVSHVNTLLKNQVSSDHNVRKMFHLIKYVALQNSNLHNRMVYFNIRNVKHHW